jgi:putative MATE family efflux protein
MSIEAVTNKDEELLAVHGSLWEAIWFFSWPIVINMGAFAFGSFVDTWVAGRLGTDAQAAMGIGWQIRYFVMMLTLALEVGTLAVVSRYFGASDKANAIEAARQSLIFGGIFGIFSVIIGLPTCKPLLHLLGASAAVEQQGWEYLKFILVANIPSTLLWTTQSIFRSVGDVRTTMETTIAASVLVVIFDVAFCLYPFHMGIGGIGLSWILSGAVGFAWNVYKLSKSELADCLKIIESLGQGISKEWFMRFMKIGFPGCLQEIALIMASFGLFYILSFSSPSAVNQAAWGVGWRVEELLVFNLMWALSLAVAIIVGQNLGAGKPERAEQATWYVIYAGIAINLLIACLLWFFALPVANFMSTEVAVVKVLVDYFHFIAWTEPFFGVYFILSGAMQGAGYTRVPMLLTVFCLCILRLAVAYYLSVILGYGANGTWIAMAGTSVIAGVLMLAVFKWGRWKEQTI